MPHDDARALPDEQLARMLDLVTEQIARYRVADLRLTYCNRAWAAQFAAEPADLVGIPLDTLLNEHEQAGLHSQLARLSPQVPYLRDTEVRPASRQPGRWIEWADRYLDLPTGPEILAVGRDVTERHEAEQRLAASEGLFRTLAEASADLVWRLRTVPVPELVYLSPSITALTGWRAQDLLGPVDGLAALLDPTSRDALRRAIAGDTPRERFDLRIRRADETWLVLEMQVAQLPDGWQGVGRDVTQVRELQADLADLALRDPLTGVANRRGLDVLLSSALAASARHGHGLVLSYVDLDGFKAVNDEYGHAAGDAVLTELARRLEHALRGRDCVARVGGDEFVAVHQAQPGVASAIAARLAVALEAPYRLPDGTDVVCPPSIGVADSTQAGTPAALIDAADRAMYAVKRARRAQRLAPAPVGVS